MEVTTESVPGAGEMLLALRLDRVEAARLRRLAGGGEGAAEAIVRAALGDYLDERERGDHRRRVAQAILTGVAVQDPRVPDPGRPAGAPVHSRKWGAAGDPAPSDEVSLVEVRPWRA